MLRYIISRLVTLLKINDALLQVSNILNLNYALLQVSNILVITVCVKFISCTFQIFLLFVPEMSTSFTSYVAQISVTSV